MDDCVCDSCLAWLSVWLCVWLSVYLPSLSYTDPKERFNLAMDVVSASVDDGTSKPFFIFSYTFLSNGIFNPSDYELHRCSTSSSVGWCLSCTSDHLMNIKVGDTRESSIMVVQLKRFEK